MSGSGAGQAPLPPYTVRRSARAHRARLTVSARDGLVLVLPARWRGDADAVVASKRGWAERSLARVAEERALHLAGPEALLPHEIELRALGRTVCVEYRQGSGSRVSARRRGHVLVVSGAIDDADGCLAALQRWLAREASAALPQRCGELARATGLTPTKVRVASARTRWGSCSAKGTVMLGRNLVFLPAELVDALIYHELAHLRVLDHSPRFWSLLATLDPQVLAHRAQLRKAAGFVPAWADV